MNDLRYVMMLKKTKEYRRLNKAALTRHIENLRRLDEDGQMEFCGAFKGYPGMAGMVILKAENLEEAKALCEREPLVAEGFATYELNQVQAAHKENNYLL